MTENIKRGGKKRRSKYKRKKGKGKRVGNVFFLVYFFGKGGVLCFPPQFFLSRGEWGRGVGWVLNCVFCGKNNQHWCVCVCALCGVW